VNSFVYVPFVASIVASVLIRVGAGRLWPRAAVWAITVSSAALAASTIGALVVLASPLPAQAPPIADAGRWQPGAVASHSPIPWIVSALALLLLLALVWRCARTGAALIGEVRDALTVSRAWHANEVVVIEDEMPHAHAVGLGVTGRGTIVLSSSLLTLLDDDERAAVIAHERSHLRQRHALFSVVVRLAAAANPLLVGAPRDLEFALERDADEAAADRTNRSVVASALAKAALAMLERGALPANALAFHRLGLTERIAAMIDEPDRRSRPAWIVVAVAIGAGLALAWATHDTERFFEAVRLRSHR
jgi:beta-lactamase regulating signal transducer with metallopeptidase domain